MGITVASAAKKEKYMTYNNPQPHLCHILTANPHMTLGTCDISPLVPEMTPPPQKKPV